MEAVRKQQTPNDRVRVLAEYTALLSQPSFLRLPEEDQTIMKNVLTRVGAEGMSEEMLRACYLEKQKDAAALNERQQSKMPKDRIEKAYQKPGEEENKDPAYLLREKKEYATFLLLRDEPETVLSYQKYDSLLEFMKGVKNKTLSYTLRNPARGMEEARKKTFLGKDGRPSLSKADEDFRQAGEIKWDPAKEHVLHPDMVKDTITEKTEAREKALIEKYLLLMDSPALSARKNVLEDHEKERQAKAEKIEIEKKTETLKEKSEAFLKKYRHLVNVMNKVRRLDFTQLGTEKPDAEFIKYMKRQLAIPDFEVKDQDALDQYMKNAGITEDVADYRELYRFVASLCVFRDEMLAAYERENAEIHELAAFHEDVKKAFDKDHSEDVEKIGADVAQIPRIIEKLYDLQKYLKNLADQRHENRMQKEFDDAKEAFTKAIEAAQKKVMENHYGFAEKCRTDYGSITKADREDYEKARKEYHDSVAKLKKEFKTGEALSAQARKHAGQEAVDRFADSFDEDFKVKLSYYDNIEWYEKFKFEKKPETLKKGLETTDGITFAAEDHKGGITADVRLEEISKKQFEELRNGGPEKLLLARRLYIEYKVRNADQLGVRRMDPAMERVTLVNGIYTSIEKDAKEDGATVTYQRLPQEGNAGEDSTYEPAKEGQRLKVYPDPRSLYAFGNVVQQGETNHLGYRGVCGQASAANIINQLYRMQLADENITVDLSNRLGLITDQKYYPVLEKDGTVKKTQNGDLVKSDYFDNVQTGGTRPKDMKMLFQSYNLDADFFWAKNEAATAPKKLAERIRAGEQVLMSVNAKLLGAEGKTADLKKDPEILESMTVDRRKDFMNGTAYSSHWINVCGVYYPEGAKEDDEPAGFLIKNTGRGGGFRMIETALLYRAFRGDNEIKTEKCKLFYVKKPIKA